MYPVIEKTRLSKITPWYIGFKGSIYPDKEGTFQSKGVWNWIDDQTIEVTELPLGIWTEDYKDFLITLIQNNSPILKDFENHYTDKNVKFILKLYPNVSKAIEPVLETEFKLVSNKNLNMNNIHLYNEEGTIEKFKDASHIIKEWSKVRLLKYYERKKHQLKVMHNKYTMLSAKVKFIQDIVNGKLKVMNRKNKDLEEDLKQKGYPMLSEKVDVDEEKE